MANIRVTPETLHTQGNDLISFAGNLTEILGSIESKVNEIIDAWDGLAQDSYYDMYANMKQSLDKFPELVEALGQATTAAADAFNSVDEQLSSSFKASAQ